MKGFVTCLESFERLLYQDHVRSAGGPSMGISGDYLRELGVNHSEDLVEILVKSAWRALRETLKTSC